MMAGVGEDGPNGGAGVWFETLALRKVCTRVILGLTKTGIVPMFGGERSARPSY
jgi:hypothetical protein